MSTYLNDCGTAATRRDTYIILLFNSRRGVPSDAVGRRTDNDDGSSGDRGSAAGLQSSASAGAASTVSSSPNCNTAGGCGAALLLLCRAVLESSGGTTVLELSSGKSHFRSSLSSNSYSSQTMVDDDPDMMLRRFTLACACRRTKRTLRGSPALIRRHNDDRHLLMHAALMTPPTMTLPPAPGRLHPSAVHNSCLKTRSLSSSLSPRAASAATVASPAGVAAAPAGVSVPQTRSCRLPQDQTNPISAVGPPDRRTFL
eukprot:1185317-Prorocentrum_minimum.AAC.3